MEHLHGAAQEREQARNRIAKGVDLAARLEEAHDLIVYAEPGLAVVLGIVGNGRRGLGHGRGRRYGGAGCASRRRWRRRRSRERANGAGIGDDLAAVVGQAEEYELRVGQVHMAGDRVVAARLAATLLAGTEVGDVGARVQVEIGVVGRWGEADADGGVSAGIVVGLIDRVAVRAGAGVIEGGDRIAAEQHPPLQRLDPGGHRTTQLTSPHKASRPRHRNPPFGGSSASVVWQGPVKDQSGSTSAPICHQTGLGRENRMENKELG